jgi:Ser-tRNA(Ala) deacylase AlaX
MTELIYQIDAYQKECDARVIELDPDNLGIVLDRTVFYPGGGGQPHDTGTLTCGSHVFPVTRVKKTASMPSITWPAMEPCLLLVIQSTVLSIGNAASS